MIKGALGGGAKRKKKRRLGGETERERGGEEKRRGERDTFKSTQVVRCGNSNVTFI